MKRLPLLLAGLLALLANACEKHSAAELTEGSERPSDPKVEHGPRADEPKVEGEKPSEAPKYFPEAK